MYLVIQSFVIWSSKTRVNNCILWFLVSQRKIKPSFTTPLLQKIFVAIQYTTGFLIKYYKM